MEISWSEFKQFVDSRGLSVQYLTIGDNYHLRAFDGVFMVACLLPRSFDNSETQEFESTYKPNGNKQLELIAADGRPIVRSDSRPRDYYTTFICRGDSMESLGDGKLFQWDFSTEEDIVTDALSCPIPDGYKRKRIEVGFSEKIYIKEGTMYFFGAPKGQHIDFYCVCKTGSVYEDPNGQIPGSYLGLRADKLYTQAQCDTPVIHYVNHHFMCGDCPMGDELNTEGASESGLPTMAQGYVIWVEVTTPNSDNTSHGFVDLEVYRRRTLLLPGETL